MKKIKIGYFADGPWSHKAFSKIINDKSLEIAFVVPRKKSQDKTLISMANNNNIECLKDADVNSKNFLEKLKKYNCDLFVSMSFNQIFKKNFLNLPKYRTINCHAGKLPFYRGRNILNWVLINDEKEFGITVHYVDEGIDTGDIILQRTYPITDNDSYNSLLEKSYSECAQILYDSIKLIQSNRVKVVKQNSIDKIGSYFRRRVEGDEFIDWNKNAREIFNLIRAISHPGPLARTKYNNNLILIGKSRVIDNNIITSEGASGEIMQKTKSGYIIKCHDSLLEIQDINLELNIGEKFS